MTQVGKPHPDPHAPDAGQSPRDRGVAAILAATVLLAVAWTASAGSVPSTREVRAGVQASLDSSGHRWALATVEGRRVILTGSSPSEALASDAVTRAGAAVCRTWYGEVPCASEVLNLVVAESDAWPALSARVEAGSLVLSGRVPDAATRDVAVGIAKRAIKDGRLRKLVDSLDLSGHFAAAGVDSTVGRAVDLATMCRESTIAMLDGVLEVRCSDPIEGDSALYELLAEPLPSGVMGPVRVQRASSDSLSP